MAELDICSIFHVSIRLESFEQTGVKENGTITRGVKICRAVKKRTDNLSFCIWSNGSTRIRNEYIEETLFSRLLRASVWHLISRESYWRFDRRPARYLVFAFPTLIPLESSKWSRQHERIPWIEQCVVSEYLITKLLVLTKCGEVKGEICMRHISISEERKRKT